MEEIGIRVLRTWTHWMACPQEQFGVKSDAGTSASSPAAALVPSPPSLSTQEPFAPSPSVRAPHKNSSFSKERPQELTII